ncbi:hypothetical protein HW932_20100 [Allochromatium humboldtianum]|uniref:Uncharacterized protein n=1 Tax=Allochromatium humboldtianum TaxID=504901 RepID=A0A850REX2_9GAMM|nr:hypothetical protein [Allochromatium humboldtianum]NVZ11555.1 hypothetical protein [Allochromatium humboldtianum]
MKTKLIGVDKAFAVGERFGLDDNGQFELLTLLYERHGEAPWPESLVARNATRMLCQNQQKSQQQAFERLLAANGDEAVGLELRHHTLEQWAAIFPDASEPGRFRHQYFDARGFFSHGTFDTAQAALKAAIREGFCVLDPGVLDRLSQTPEWASGLIALEAVQRHNADIWERRQAALLSTI